MGAYVRWLLAALLGLGGVVLSATPAAAAPDLSLDAVFVNGTTVELNHTWHGHAYPGGTARVRFTSTTDTSKSWEFRWDAGSPSMRNFPNFSFNPRQPLSGSRFNGATPPSGMAAWLPNDTYTVQSWMDVLAHGTRYSSTDTVTIKAFTAPPTLLGLHDYQTLGWYAADLDVTFPEAPKAGSVQAIYSGQGQCAGSTVTYTPTNATSVIEAGLRYDGAVIGMAGTVTGTWQRGCRYVLEVRWRNADEDPAYPNDPTASPYAGASVVGLRVPSVPGVPTDVQVTPGTGQLTAAWTPPADNGGSAITGYVARALPSDRTCTTSGATGCTITGLEDGETYDVVVEAVNSVGAGARSLDATEMAGIVPGAPSDVQVVGGNASALVTWNAPVTGPIDGYTVTASPGGITCTTGLSTQCNLQGLVNGTTYDVSVVTNAGRLVSTATAAQQVTPATTPDAPYLYSVTTTPDTAIVHWWAPADAGGHSVTQYRMTIEPGGFECVTTETTCTITGLTPGSNYAFAVRARNLVGEGAAGTQDSITPNLWNPPAPPTPAPPLRGSLGGVVKKSGPRAALVYVATNRRTGVTVRMQRGKLAAARAVTVSGATWVRVPLTKRTAKLLNGKPMVLRLSTSQGRVLDTAAGRARR